jgi:hypothetical protein
MIIATSHDGNNPKQELARSLRVFGEIRLRREIRLHKPESGRRRRLKNKHDWKIGAGLAAGPRLPR